MSNAFTKWLFTKRNAHRVTTAHLQALYPFYAERGLGAIGTYLGVDHSLRAFCFDEFAYYAHGVAGLTGPNSVVLGEVGSAKSTNIKLRISRNLAYGRKAVCVDPKSEYTELVDSMNEEADELGLPHQATVIRLERGSNVVLNPLESSGDDLDRQSLTLAIVAAARGCNLSDPEKRGVMLALAAILENTNEPPTLPRLVHRLLEPTEQMAIDMHRTQAALRDELRDCAYALDRLVTGDLAGMFDGPTSTSISLDHKLVVIDLSAIDDPFALSILMTCATAWLNSRVHAERKAGDTTKRLLVIDEAWRILADPLCADWLQRGFKLSRSLGIAHVIVMHRLSDLHAAGDAGSRTQAQAMGLVSDAQTRIIYRQMPGEVPLVQAAFGLTDAEAAWLPNLGRGRALWKIGDRTTLLVQMTPATPDEWRIVDTDARMRSAATAVAI